MPKILAVDDEPQILALEERLLTREGHTVVKAPDGAAAMKLLTEHDFDLVLLDVMMPKFNGFEVSRFLRTQERNRRTPVVFVTARSDKEAYREGTASGGTVYLTKPFTTKQFLSTVKAMLRLPKPRKA